MIIAVCFSIFGTDDFRPNVNISTNPEESQTLFILDENSNLPDQFFLLFPLIDEPITNWTLPEPSIEELKEAIDVGKLKLGDKEMLEEIIITPVLNSPTYRHQVNYFLDF